MAYIGNQPTIGQYRKLDDISGSFNGSLTAFTMQVGSTNVSAGSVFQLLISLGGVIQNPGTDFTVSGSTLTFTTAPTSGLDFFGILMGQPLNTATPGDGTITGAKLAPAFNYDSGLLFLDDTNNRVGIGTTSPDKILTLRQDNAGGEGASIRLHNSSATVGSNNKLIFTSSTTATFQSAAIIATRTASGTTIAFESDGTNERLRIDESGRLLVGTATSRSVGVSAGFPALLQLETTNYTGFSLINNTNDEFGVQLSLGKSRSTAVGGSAIVQSGDELGEITFAGADNTDVITNAASIRCLVDGTPGANDMPGRLMFSTTVLGASSPTERMRLGNSGSLQVVTSGGADVIYASTPASAGTSVAIYRGLRNATTGSPGTGTDVFFVFSNGNVQNTNNSYTAISDIKLKENIVDASSQWDDLKVIQVRNYNFKEETGHETHTQLGVIAQEIELVSPGLISESPDRDEEGNDLGTVTKSVNYSVLYMKAVKALQEAMERIEVLEAKVDALEGN